MKIRQEDRARPKWGLKTHTVRNHQSGTVRFVFWTAHLRERVENRYWGDSSSGFSSTLHRFFLSCFLSVTCVNILSTFFDDTVGGEGRRQQKGEDKQA